MTFTPIDLIDNEEYIHFLGVRNLWLMYHLNKPPEDEEETSEHDEKMEIQPEIDAKQQSIIQQLQSNGLMLKKIAQIS